MADGPELKVRPDTLFFRQLGPTPPAAQQVSVFAENGILGSFTAVAATSSGGNWLSVSPAGGTGPGRLTVAVNTSGMASGQFSGRITVTAPGLEDSPRTVRVQLTISTPGSGGALMVAPHELEFEVTQGGAAPAPRTVAIFPPSGGAWSATASVRTPAGGRWLRVTPASGNGAGILQVQVDPAGLARGEYQGLITVTSGSSTARVEVELEIEAPRPPRLRLDPRAFNFTVEPNSTTPPAPRTLNISNSGGGTFSWTATATVNTPPGAAWLSLIPTAGSGSGQATVRANPAGLPPGMYSGRITVRSGDSQEDALVFLRILGPTRPLVSVRPGSLRFSAAAGVPVSASRTVEIKSRSTSLSYTATASTARGGNWLRVTPPSGAVPGSFTASLDGGTVATLPSGVYTGSILVRVPGAAQETHNVHVSLRVGSGQEGGAEAARLEVEPGGLALTAVRGGPNPAPRTVRLEPEEISSLAWTAAATTVSGGNWLSVSPTSGTTTAAARSVVNVSVNVATLAAGNYTGSVIFTPAPASGAPPVSVGVRLVVTSGTPATGALSAALFTEPAQGFIRHIDVPLNVGVTLLDSAGSPMEGLTVMVRSSGPEPPLVLEDLGEGEYGGVFRSLASGPLALTASVRNDAAREVASFAVSGDVESALGSHAVVFQGGSVSAASFADSPTPVAPGSLVSLFGRGIAGPGGAASRAPLPFHLEGVSVTVGGLPAPLLAAARGALDQINFQVPFELEGALQAQVVVNNNGVLSVPETITLASAVPALFTTSQTGGGAAAALHGGDFSAVTAARPAVPGEVILLYATGLGAVRGEVASGAAATGEVPVRGQVSVTIGGRPAEVRYAGLAPGFVGLYQINVLIPSGVSGEALVDVLVDGTPATGRATLLIR